MNHPSQVLPELVAATLSCTLWFIPKDLSVAQVNIGKLLRATGYSTSIVLYGKGYLCLLLNEEKFKTNHEKQLIDESVELELYTYRRGAELDKAKLQIKHEVMQAAAPHFQQMYQLELESTPKPDEPQQLTEEEKLNGARAAIESALAPTVVQAKFSEDDIRKEFPESGDSTCWKAILRALQSGYSKQEIVTHVLGCNGTNQALGEAYFDLLRSKFL